MAKPSVSPYRLNYPGRDDGFAWRSLPVKAMRRWATYPGGRKSFLVSRGWTNRLIFGDNLDILRALAEEAGVAGKVRLIYIDPPFATGTDFHHGRGSRLAYSDKRIGPDYLEFLRARLTLLREMLADDGSFYIHIDTKVGHYVKVLLDEIFGQERFVNDIARVKCNPKNFSRNAFGNIRDTVLFYTKTKRYLWNEAREEMGEEDIKRLFPRRGKEERRYTTTPLHAPGATKNGPTGQAWRGLLPPKGRHWRYPPSELEKLHRAGLIEWSRHGVPRKKIYAEDVLRRGKKRQDIWEFKDPPYPSYPTEKNSSLLRMIIQTSSNPGDLVMDAFAGSGSTLMAAEELERRWIGIDNSPVSLEVACQRLAGMPLRADFALDAAEGAALPQAFEKVLQQKRA
jgi:adenine-specific DNA-methyltransferase